MGTQSVDLSIPYALDGTAFTRIAGSGVHLNVEGQELSGDFIIEVIPQATDDGSTNRVVASAENLELLISNGDADLLNVTGGSGYFVFTDSGAYGSATGTVNADSSALSADFEVSVDLNQLETPVDNSFEIDGEDNLQISLPAGPLLRVTATETQISFSDHILLSGDFYFQRQESDGNTTVGIEAIGVSTSISAGDNGASLDISNANGQMILNFKLECNISRIY